MDAASAAAALPDRLDRLLFQEFAQRSRQAVARLTFERLMALRRVMPPVKPSGSASSNRLIETNDTLNAPVRIKGSAEAPDAYRIYSHVHTERGVLWRFSPAACS